MNMDAADNLWARVCRETTTVSSCDDTHICGTRTLLVGEHSETSGCWLPTWPL